jgi:hypothetical protein
MSKRLISIAAVAVTAAALALPSGASAVTRATGAGAYAKTTNGWAYECQAAPVGAYIVNVYRCYIDTSTGQARLCGQLRVQALSDIIINPSWYYGTLQCSDPAAPGAAAAGAVRLSA